MKALKIIGGILGTIGLASFVFWFGWLVPPNLGDVCDHVAELSQKEGGPAVDKAECEQSLQPPKFGKLPYVKRVKCIRDADSLGEANDCRTKKL